MGRSAALVRVFFGEEEAARLVMSDFWVGGLDLEFFWVWVEVVEVVEVVEAKAATTAWQASRRGRGEAEGIKWVGWCDGLRVIRFYSAWS